MTQVNWLITINLSQLIAVLFFGYRVLRFVNRLEFKVELMWDDYEQRTGHYHKRKDDSES
jgi:hypothetical protein